MTILTLLVMSVGGRIGAWLAGLLSQPSVLGELLIGVALGATPWFVGADADPAISLVAQAGAVPPDRTLAPVDGEAFRQSHGQEALF